MLTRTQLLLKDQNDKIETVIEVVKEVAVEKVVLQHRHRQRVRLCAETKQAKPITEFFRTSITVNPSASNIWRHRPQDSEYGHHSPDGM